MENTLHRQIKALYAPESSQEVRVDRFRIDAVRGRRLIEVQCASLSALRRKIPELLATHSVLVVKPLAARKLLVNRESRDGDEISRRYSPVRQTLFHIFDELVHFGDVFPHRRLTLEVVLAEWEEHRAPKRRRWRFRPQHRVVDRVLQTVHTRVSLKTAADLAALLPADLPDEFTTEHLAAAAGVPRWLAQKAAWCLRKAGVLSICGKQGRSTLHCRVARKAPRRRRAG